MSSLRITASLAALSMAIAAPAPGAFAAEASVGETGTAVSTAGPALIEGLIVTGSRERARDVAGSAVYFDQEALDAFSYADVNRVLRQAPGVYLQEEDGFGLRPNIGIRGSGTDRAGRIAVMEDGVLIAPAPYAAPAAYYFPRMARMSGVEVVKGPSAIKYGPLTTGGALQFISTPIPDVAGRVGGRGELYAGSYGGVRAHAALGGWTAPTGPVQLGGQIEGLSERSDGFKSLDSGGDTGFEITDAVFKLGLRTTPGAALPQSLELKLQRYDETSSETYLGLTLADFAAAPYRRYRGSQMDRMNARHTTWQATHRMEISDRLTVTTVAYRTETTRAWYKLNDVLSGGALRSISSVLANPTLYAEGYAALVGAPGYSSAANALRVRNNNRAYYAQGVQSVAVLRFSGGGLDHELEVSARLHRDEEDRFQQDDRYQMVEGEMALTAAGLPGSQENRVGQARATAYFIRDTVRAGRLTLTPGIRYETIDLKRTSYVLGDASRSTVLGVSRSEVDVWIPGLGATFELTPELLVVAGVHRGFSNPAPGSSADPETSWNYEAGFRLARGDVFVEAIAFFNDYQNLVGTCTASTGGGCTIGAQFDGGAVEVFGVEFTAAHDLGGWLGLDVGLPVSAVYTFTEAEFKTGFVSGYEPWGTVTAGFELPFLPPHQLTLNAGVHADRWRVDATVSRVSETRGVAGTGPVPAVQRIDARTQLDLSGEVDLTEQLSVFLEAQNLTDEVYNVGFAPAGARPGAPRMVLGGVKVRF